MPESKLVGPEEQEGEHVYAHVKMRRPHAFQGAVVDSLETICQAAGACVRLLHGTKASNSLSFSTAHGQFRRGPQQHMLPNHSAQSKDTACTEDSPDASPWRSFIWQNTSSLPWGSSRLPRVKQGTLETKETGSPATLLWTLHDMHNNLSQAAIAFQGVLVHCLACPCALLLGRRLAGTLSQQRLPWQRLSRNPGPPPPPLRRAAPSVPFCSSSSSAPSQAKR